MKRTVTQHLATFHATRTPQGFDPANEFVVCPWGTVQTRRGPVTVNERTLSVFEANQRAARRDAVAGDFEHGTLKGQEPCKVAGYWTPRVVRDVGIVVALHHTTPEVEMVKAGHYPDISPAVERDANGVVEGLHSFAFCRHGEIAHPNLEMFSVEVTVEMDGAEGGCNPNTTKAPIMTDAEMLAELLSALTGETIAPDASPETKAAALAKAKAAAKPAAAAAEGMSADVTAALTTLSADVAALQRDAAAFRAAEGARAVDALIAEATAAGKKPGLKRDRLIALGAEGTREYLASLEPGVVTPDLRNNPAATAAGSATKPADVFSADTLTMWARNGIDADAMFKKWQARQTEAPAEPGAAATADA